MKISISGLPVVLLATLLLATPAAAATRYVDTQLSGDCPNDYAPATRDCGSGSDIGHASLASGVAAATSGDMVILRDGSYPQLVPSSSGTKGQPIVFKAYDGEKALFSNIGQPAILVKNQSYITIEDLHVDDVLGWGRLEDADHIIIRNNTFTKATAGGTTGGLKLIRSNHNVLVGNLLEDGNDNVVVQESDANLVENNVFRRGRHSLLSIRCGDFNVIRGNELDNPDQKAAEIYDCEGVSDAPYELDATKHNLFEGNRFVYTKETDKPHRYNGIQYAGQLGVVRHNLFYDNLGGGLGVQVYSDEALFNYGHRIYNNTFVDNHCFGLFSSDDVSPNQFFDVVVKGNLFFGNADCSGAGPQHSIGNEMAVDFADNELASADPGFVDEPGRDLRLVEGSPMIDAAPYATRTVSSGSGTTLPVIDAGYFFDGFGIDGQMGDEIQLEGQAATARVVAIDYQTNELSLDTELVWDADIGVHLAYGGKGPDMGAHERGKNTGGGGSGAGGSGTGGGGTGGGMGASGGTGGAGASPGAGGENADDGGCACRAAGVPPKRGGLAALLLLLCIATARRSIAASSVR